MGVTFTSRIPQVRKQAQARSEAAVELTAKMVEVHASAGVPVDKGELRATIKVEDVDPLEKRVVAGSGEAFHAHFVEFGTRNMPAEPFLIPAGEAARDKFIQLMKGIL